MFIYENEGYRKVRVAPSSIVTSIIRGETCIRGDVVGSHMMKIQVFDLLKFLSQRLSTKPEMSSVMGQMSIRVKPAFTATAQYPYR